MNRPTSMKTLLFESLENRQLLAADGAQLVSDAYSVHQNDRDLTLDVLANDEFDDDYAGPKLITDVSLGDRGGRVRISEGGQLLRYDPPADYSGPESFTYFVDTAFSAKVSLRIVSPLAPDFFDFHPDGETYVLDVMRNDPFWEGYLGAREITLVSASSQGATVEIAADGKSLIYSRLDHTYGRDVLTYIVDDKYPAAVEVEFEDPLTDDQFQLVQFDAPHSHNLIQNDPFWLDYSGNRQITHILDEPEGAFAEISEDGESLVFDPGDIHYGVHHLRYVVDSKYEASVRVHVERPVRDDYVTVDANSDDFEFRLMDNDYYYELGSRFRNKMFATEKITEVSATEKGGTAVISPAGTGVLYTPPAGYIGQDEFTYVSDGKHLATVHVTVRDPLADNGQRNDSFRIVQGSVDNRLDVLANDFFGDGYTGDRVITNVSSVEGADVTIVEGGEMLLFTPLDDRQAYSFEYEIDNALSAEVSVTTRSIASHESFVFDRSSTVTLDIVDRLEIPPQYAGPATISSITQPDNGGVASIGSDGKSVVVELGVGTGTFEYTIDGKYSATISTRFNQRVAHDYFVVHQNSGVAELDVLANDFSDWTNRRWGTYRGPRLITDVESTGNGTVEISEDGTHLRFQPHADFVGTDTITYVVDGYLETTAQVDIARLLRHDRVRVEPDSQDNSLNVLGNDLVGGDYDGPLVITSVTGSDNASISVAPDGKSVIYSPSVGFAGSDEFEYTVDGQLKADVIVEVRADSADLYPRVASLEAFKQLVLDAARSSTGDGRFVLGDFTAVDGAVSPKRDHSETNVQVEGVDEADLVETDSDYLYTLTHGQAVITKAWPADALEVVSRTDIKGQAIGQYLHGDRLTVISQDNEPFFYDDFSIDRIYPYFGKSYTYVTVLDVTDRANPKLVQRTEFEGAHVQTRRIEDFVYVVVRDNESLAPPRIEKCEQNEEDNSSDCRFETDEEYFHRIETEFPSVVEDLLPNYESYDADDKLARTGLLVKPEDIFDPISEGSSSLVTVAAINVTNNVPGLASTSGVLTTGASQLYVTTNNLYVFEDHYDWLDESLSDSPLTKILKFELERETGGVHFAATGQVPGQMLNQFSADEFNGHLRIATTVSNHRTGNYSGGNENALFVLRDDAGLLEHVGTLQNLAHDESIRSVRFFGDQALVTTFRNVDPLFSVDLSDPSDPRVQGFLTLPGFNSYLQYLDSDHVLTIGRSTGFGGGGVVMISLFDVSNTLQPVLVDQFNWEGFSRSTAETDHHAFGWFANHGTLAIPSQTHFTVRTDQDEDGYKEHAERVVEHALHAFGIDTSFSVRNDDAIKINGTVKMDSPLLRSAYIADKLYAVATDSIKSTNVATPNDTIAEVDISRPDEELPEPVEDPRLPVIADFRDRARSDLADTMGVGNDQIITVATEADQDQTRVLMRLGDQHFVYQGAGDQLERQVSDFRPDSLGHSLDWHNEDDPFDVNGDGFVSPRDVLAIVNLINDGLDLLPSATVANQIFALGDEFQVDVNNDGSVTPRDALVVINHLNQVTTAAPEPPASHRAVDALFAVALQNADDYEKEARALQTD